MLREVEEYNGADAEGKEMKSEEWGKQVEGTINEWLMMEGATSVTTFAAALTAVVAALSF